MSQNGRAFLSFDSATTLEAARNDPVGFVRGLDRATVDEVQRVPEVLLAIKESVDSDPRPGRFLLTGSADLMTLPRMADSLAGRMAVLELLPLSQSEIADSSPKFLNEIFKGRLPRAGDVKLGSELMDAVVAGGYPEVLTRSTWARRRQWHLDYVHAVVQRDIQDIAQIDQARQMPRLLRILAQHSAQLVNYSELGGPIGMTHVTTQKYTGILEQLFLIRTVAPWSTNLLKRLIKTPKLHFLDSGLLASLRQLSPQRLKADRSPFRALLETFVLSEILKLASWSDDPVEVFHFRDKDKNEADLVLENGGGDVVGIEVKASATVTAADFSGLRLLAATCGERFKIGLVLHDHDQVVPFGDRLWAAPISSLWW